MPTPASAALPCAESEALRLIATTLDTRVVLDYCGIAATLRELARRVDGLATQAFTLQALGPHSSLTASSLPHLGATVDVQPADVPEPG